MRNKVDTTRPDKTKFEQYWEFRTKHVGAILEETRELVAKNIPANLKPAAHWNMVNSRLGELWREKKILDHHRN